MNDFKDNNQGFSSLGQLNSQKGQGQNLSQRQSFARSNSPFNGQSDSSAMAVNKDANTKNGGGLMFILRKSEKLTTALYMVTDIMPEREPMKWKMREAAVELLSDTTLALDAGMGERITVLGAAIRKIERVVAFLDIAQSSRMVSEMNASVLKKEYIGLKSVVEGEWEKLFDRSKSIFTDSFFDVPEDAESTFPQMEEQTEAQTNERVNAPQQTQTRYTFAPLDNGQMPSERLPSSAEARTNIKTNSSTNINKDIARASMTAADTSAGSSVRPNVRLGGNTPHAEKHALPVKVHADPMTPLDQTNTASRTERLPEVNERHLPQQRASSQVLMVPDRNTDLLVRRSEGEVGKGDRRTIILALIKQKPQLAVKDISKSIPGVSEKTIQRELLAMVSEGILIKRGERRWSTYSLS